MTLSQAARAVRGRWKLFTFVFALIVGSVTALSLLLPKRYLATAAIVIDYRGIDPVSGSVYPTQLLPGYLATQLDIIASRNVALRVVDQLGIDRVPAVREAFMEETEGRGSLRDWVGDLLIGNLRLEPSRESSVVKISYMSTDARFSAAVANAFADAYMQATLDLKVAPAKQTSLWFDEQLKGLKDKLEKSQAKLSAFQQKHGIVAADERLDVESARLNELTSQLIAAQAQSYETDARARQVNGGARVGGADAVPDVMANPNVQRLKADVTAGEAKLSDLSARLGENHPQVQSMVETIASLRRQLAAEIGNASSGVRNISSVSQSREGSIRSALAEQKEKVLSLKQLRDELTLLAREADSDQRAYDSAMQRTTQTRLESRLSQANVAVVNRAIEPLDPARPLVTLNIALAIFVGLNLALGLTLWRELGDRRMRSSDDLVDLLGVPLLSEMPRAKGLGRRARLSRRSWPRLGYRAAEGA